VLPRDGEVYQRLSTWEALPGVAEDEIIERDASAITLFDQRMPAYSPAHVGLHVDLLGKLLGHYARGRHRFIRLYVNPIKSSSAMAHGPIRLFTFGNRSNGGVCSGQIVSGAGLMRRDEVLRAIVPVTTNADMPCIEILIRWTELDARFDYVRYRVVVHKTLQTG
jgi:hypothetical protein